MFHRRHHRIILIGSDVRIRRFFRILFMEQKREEEKIGQCQKINLMLIKMWSHDKLNSLFELSIFLLFICMINWKFSVFHFRCDSATEIWPMGYEKKIYSEIENGNALHLIRMKIVSFPFFLSIQTNITHVFCNNFKWIIQK